MYALVKSGPSAGIDYTQIDAPRPGAGEVLVKIEATAICGSDLNFYRWNAWAQDVAGDVPFVPGHEGCGTVVELGPEVRRLRAGDRVEVTSGLGEGELVVTSGAKLLTPGAEVRLKGE